MNEAEEIQRPLLLGDDSSSLSEDGAVSLLNAPTAATACLPRPLFALFALNGVTLALPTTALLYIVNTRVALPVELLPVYGAVAFLPCSFKPLYAYLSIGATRRGVTRSQLIATLLIVNSLFLAATTTVPRNGILLLFALAFGTGLSNAWPEFLLGLSLLDLISGSVSVSHLQASAATARNVGALGAHLSAMAFFWIDPGLSNAAANGLLMATVVASLVGAAIAAVARVGQCPMAIEQGWQLVDGETRRLQSTGSGSQHSYQSLEAMDGEPDEGFEDDVSSEDADETALAAGGDRSSIRLIALLQAAMILLITHDPIVAATSHWAWTIMAVLAMGGLIVTAGHALLHLEWKPAYNVGLYLILRNALPSGCIIMESYTYSLFGSRPSLLQAFSVVSMLTMTLSSWSFGKLWSPWTNGDRLYTIIAATTALASVVALGEIAMVEVVPHQRLAAQVALTIAIRSAVTVTAEWKVLPDVVLATVSAMDGDLRASSSMTTAAAALSGQDELGIQYGVLLSCLDFGGQLGALLSAPLVKLLHINREEGWDNLPVFIQISAGLSLLSLTFLYLLPSKSSTVNSTPIAVVSRC